MTRKVVGPFTWERKDHGDGDNEVWNLVLPEDCTLVHFCVKNYGGEPNKSSGFSGWRVVSGGPFTRAGGWKTRDGAMRGAIPFLLSYYRAQAKEQQARARLTARQLSKFVRSMRAA